MMYYAFLRILYAAYFIGTAYLIFKAVSWVVYDDEENTGLRELPSRFGYALIWPLALLTKAGRDKLERHLEK